MGTCSICKKVSATDSDHIHCVEKRRIELENLQLKDTITEKLDLEKDPNNMGKEINRIPGESTVHIMTQRGHVDCRVSTVSESKARLDGNANRSQEASTLFERL